MHISTITGSRPSPAIPDDLRKRAKAITFIYGQWLAAKALSETAEPIVAAMRNACGDTAEMLDTLAGVAGQLNYWHHEHHEDQEAHSYSMWIGELHKVAKQLRTAEDPEEMLSAVNVLHAMASRAGGAA